MLGQGFNTVWAVALKLTIFKLIIYKMIDFWIAVILLYIQCGCRTIRDVHRTGPSLTGNQGARHGGHLLHRPWPEEGKGVDGADRGMSSIIVFCTSYICDSCDQMHCRCVVCMLNLSIIKLWVIYNKKFCAVVSYTFQLDRQEQFFFRSFFFSFRLLRGGCCWKIHVSSFHLFFSRLYICKANKDKRFILLTNC